MTPKDYKHILVIDDDPLIRTMLKRNVELLRPGYQVATAHNGRMALVQFQQQWFDVVVTDFEMPGLNGLELAGEMRRLSPATRIVLMTGSNPLRFNGSVEFETLDGYMQKPFTLKRMFEVIDSLID